MKKNAKIYVAGHTGLVGSAIVRKLRKEGYDNLLLVPHKELDLRDQKAVNDFFESNRPEYVFLAAAKVGGIWANYTKPAEFIYDNLAIEVNVIHSAWKFGVKKLLFLGSSCIYPKFAPQPMKEEYLLTGALETTNEPYAIAKIAGIKMVEAYRRQYNVNFISAMPTNLYGPNDNFDLNHSHVLPALIRKFHLAKLLENGEINLLKKDLAKFGNGFNGLETASDQEIVAYLGKFGITANYVALWGSGSPRREFLHVDDLADALLFMMKSYDEMLFLNVGWGKDITIKELAEIVKSVIGFRGVIKWDSSKPDGTPRKLLDVSRLTKLGWKPRIELEEGIKNTYDWYVRRLQSHA